MVKVDSYKWGSIVVGGKKYRHDIILLPDGSVQKRKGILLSLLAHSLGKGEMERLAKSNPEVIVVGTGASGKAHLSSEAEDYVKKTNLKVMTLPSPEAMKKLNQLIDQGKRVVALLHITC